MKEQLNKWFPFLVVLGLLANVTCLFNGIIEPDGALYASIAKKMVVNNDWVNLFGNGSDWLDKPHFPFWAAALSYKIFGINSFAYKFPAFLCFLISVLYLYRLTVLLYNNKAVAQLAVLVFMTSLHTVLANFDVRAEAYLTAFILAATYYLYLLQSRFRFEHVLLASFFCACAIMTKGIFVMITIVAGFVIHWMLSKQWKQLLNARWWLVLLFTFLMILPELYCLYLQFDMHPEKLVFGKTNVSGIRFFFWDSQFGRFFNNGPIKGEGDLSFFMHTTLWAFLPWSLALCWAFCRHIARFKNINWKSEKMIVFASAFVTFLMFSLSKFQLPHYIIIVFPHLSIFTANYLLQSSESKGFKTLTVIQSVLLILLCLLLMFIAYVYSPAKYIVPVILFLFIIFIIAWLIKLRSSMSLVLANICFVVALFSFLNLWFYPSLLKYQSGMMAGKWMHDNSIKKKVLMYKTGSYSLEFYSDAEVVWTSTNEQVDSIAAKEPVLLFTSNAIADTLKLEQWKLQPLQQFEQFHISQLSMDFLNAKTRNSQLQTNHLIELQKK